MTSDRGVQVETLARFANLKVDIIELFFPFSVHLTDHVLHA